MSLRPTNPDARAQALEAESVGVVLDENNELLMREMLHEERTHLTRVNQEVQRLESVLAGLYEEQKACVEHLGKYSLSLAPQKRLPPEVLARIFLDVQGGRPVVLPPIPSTSPWVLQSVSSQWRRVAQEEGRLWMDLDVEDPPSGKAERVATTWIPRLWSHTQSFPLSLSLGKSSAKNGAAIRKVLAPYFHRMQNFSLYVLNRSFAPMFIHHSSLFDTLESLVLHICTLDQRRRTDFPTNDQPVTIFTSTRLRKVTFIACPSPKFHDPIYFPTFCRELPWSQITHLTFRMPDMTSKELETILRRCSTLISLTFSAVCEDVSNRDPSALEISLPHLRSIAVTLNDRESYRETFRLLRVPSLKEVTLDNAGGTDPYFSFDGTELLSMIKRSGVKVESLSLLGNVEHWRPKALLFNLPDLVRLVVSQSRFIPDVPFDMMAQGKVLQDLKYLECLTGSPTSFLKLLDHQCTSAPSGGHHGIIAAKVLYDAYATDEDLDEMRRLYETLKPKLERLGKDIMLKEIRLDP